MSKTPKTIVHVNQHMIKHNQKHDTQFPVLTVKHRGKTYYAHEVIYHDGCHTKYSPEKPLSCGAVCWLETDGDVTLFDWTAVHAQEQPHKAITSKRQTLRRLGSLSWMASETAELAKHDDPRLDSELSPAIQKHEAAQ